MKEMIKGEEIITKLSDICGQMRHKISQNLNKSEPLFISGKKFHFQNWQRRRNVVDDIGRLAIRKRTQIVSVFMATAGATPCVLIGCGLHDLSANQIGIIMRPSWWVFVGEVFFGERRAQS